MPPAGIQRRIFTRFRHHEPGSTHLYLVRHGQTSANLRMQLAGHLDVPLDEVGVAQAALVAEAMTDLPLDAVVSSPLARARVTAEGIAARHGLPVSLDHRLREIHFGRAEGLTLAEAVAQFPDIARIPELADDVDFTWPGGDSRHAFHETVFSAITEIATKEMGRHVAVVCHGGVIGSFIAQLDGGSPEDFVTYPVMNCSVTHLEVHAEGTTAHRYNDIAHLDVVETTAFHWEITPQDAVGGEIER